MKKFCQAAAVMLVAAVLFFGIAVNAYESTTRIVVLVEDGNRTYFSTCNTYVRDFLENMGITLHVRDIISHDIDDIITEGMEIEITRAMPVHVRIDGAEETVIFRVAPGSTMFAFVNEFRRYTGEEFLFDASTWHRRLSANDVVELRSVRRKWREHYEEIAYGREYIETNSLYKGETEVYRAGTPGRLLVNILATYAGGIENNRVRMSEEIAADPVSAIIRVGTATPVSTAISACGQMFRYTRSLIMESTAYTLSFSCTGRHPGDPWFGVTASGMMAQVGVVAVDTNVIPFHTRMYIEGYGFAVAGDRGGAIRGYKIDVFMDTMPEARQWGRRHVRVWILED